jgi:hypothetical protein
MCQVKGAAIFQLRPSAWDTFSDNQALAGNGRIRCRRARWSLLCAGNAALNRCSRFQPRCRWFFAGHSVEWNGGGIFYRTTDDHHCTVAQNSAPAPGISLTRWQRP